VVGREREVGRRGEEEWEESEWTLESNGTGGMMQGGKDGAGMVAIDSMAVGDKCHPVGLVST